METGFFVRTQYVVLGLISCLITGSTLPATAAPTAGIQFVKGPWKTVLTKAKEQHKCVFVAIQRNACEPCQKLENEAFSDPEAGRTYNASFLSYAVNVAEADAPALVKQYAVTTYPTLLFLSENGVLLHRSTGYSGAKGLLTDAAVTLETARNPRTIAVWDKEFLSGKRDTEFLRAYLDKRAYLGLPNEAALDLYLGRILETDWALPKNVRLIASNTETARLPTFNWLLIMAENARKDPSKSNLVFYALTAANRVVQREWETAKTPADLERVIAIGHSIDNLWGITRTAAELAQRDMGKRMGFYGRTKNGAKYRELAIPIGAQAMTATEGLAKTIEANFRQPIDYKDQSETGKATAARLVAERTKHMRDAQAFAQRLDILARAYLDLMTDRTDLDQALVWATRSVELEKAPAHLDTQAQLLARLGRQDEAIEVETEAVGQALGAGYDATPYQQRLAELMKK